jgi:hypothetical protein
VTEPPDLAARIRQVTRVPCPRTAPNVEPKRVVLVPPQRPVELAFPIARALLDGGEPAVRIVGSCAPLASAWPEWATTQPGLIMTEIGAYRARSRIASTRGIMNEIRAWLDRQLSPFAGIAQPSRAFFGSAYFRLFQEVLDTHPFVPGLASGLAGCHVECVEEWAGAPVLDAMLKPSGGRCVAPRTAVGSLRAKTWRLELLARGGIYATGAVVERARVYASAARSFATIRASDPTSKPPPDIWVTLIPTWFRMNRHVLHSVVDPETARGTSVGALFFCELAPGARNEHDLRKLEGTTLWPGLGSSRDALLKSVTDQVVLPTSIPALARTLVVAAGRAARATWRVAAGPRYITVGGYALDIAATSSEVAKLLTIDVVRATTTEYATRAVARRYPMRGAVVVMATTTLAEIAMIDVVLNDEGATTVDFVHGTQGDGWPNAENNATVRVVWTYPDADALAPTGQRCVVAGMPRPVLPPRTRARAGRHVLLLSAYLHRDGRHRGLDPFIAAQHELLSIIDTFAASGDATVFRWRPHPADIPDRVDEVRAMHATMELSRGVPLAEDLAWCDVVISTPSSAVYEALFADVPVILQAQPELWGTPVTACLDPERVFYWASDGVRILRAMLPRLDAGDESQLAPERAARVRLFGPTGEPRSVGDALREIGRASPPQVPSKTNGARIERI